MNEKDICEKKYVEELVERSRKAQAIAWDYSQERVDELAAAIMYSLSRPGFAKKIAKLSFEETNLGDYDSKVSRFTGKLPQIWQDIKDVKTVGEVKRIDEKGIVKIAKPVGVIAALIPSTTADATPVFKGVLGLRGRNSVIFAPHPGAKKTTNFAVAAMREVLKLNGAPEDLFICIEQPSKQIAKELMAACDITFATGSHDMVVAAYSSGKPAYGVGVGNAVVVVDETADLPVTASMIRASKVTDNATGCSAENSLVVQDSIYEAFIQELKKQGGYFVNEQQKAKLQAVMWQDGHLSRQIVAKPVEHIAKLAEINIPVGTKFIVVEETGYGKEYPFSGEKLSLVLTVYRYNKFQQAIDIVNGIHSYSGAGHSCGIHSVDDGHIRDLALGTKTTKVLVRQPHRAGNSGNWFNGLASTFSLGCGTWGGNIVSENITQKHFLNTTWVSTSIAPIGVVPYTEEEIFGDIVHRVKLLQE